MARTKRATQASAPAKQPQPASSPEYVPDDLEVVEGPATRSSHTPATPTPGSKRRVREDQNPTPTPSKKRRPVLPLTPEPEIYTQAPPAKACSETDDEDSSSSTVISVQSSDSAGDADVEDTPKASKMNKGKKKAGNLKTSLGGTIGEAPTTDVFNEGNVAKRTPVGLLRSIDFNADCKSTWADTWIDNGKTCMFVKARSADDPLLGRKSILDPYMLKHGHYENLPKAKYVLFAYGNMAVLTVSLSHLQLYSQNENMTSTFTDGSVTSMVPGLSISTWECFGIDKAYVASLHRFKRQGQYANASTMDFTDVIFKETYSRQGPSTAFLLCDKDKCRPMTFIYVGAIMESCIKFGKPLGADGNGPTAKVIVVLGHRFEYERFSCLHCTAWHGDDLSTPINRRLITFQTKNRPNVPHDRDTEKADEPELRVGKLGAITSYASPSKKYTSKSAQQTSLDFADEIPVYDGRDEAYDPEDIEGSLARLPKYICEDGEIPEGTGVVVGYSSATSKWASVWRLTFYIQFIVVIAD
ncbi:hypothetical protein MD484_g8635, partial [Candolleomyces efflorescens]